MREIGDSPVADAEAMLYPGGKENLNDSTIDEIDEESSMKKFDSNAPPPKKAPAPVEVSPLVMAGVCFSYMLVS